MKRILLFVLTLLLLLPAPLALGETATPEPAPSPAPDPLLNGRCTLDWAGFCHYPDRLTDNSYATGVELRKGSKGSIRWTADVPAGIVYWEWIVPPDECKYTFFNENDQPISSSVRHREGDRGYLLVPQGARGVTMEVVSGYAGGDCRLTEWHVYEAGKVPEHIHLWEVAPEKCDIMLVSAHSDDELVMMGGILPTYAAERGLRVQVVYCYVPEQDRHEEALNGLWHCGVRTLPVFFIIEDEGRLRFAEKLTREIRRFRPEVVITHDIAGEYGNPGHKLVSRNCREAVAAAADETMFPASAKEYGLWQVKKLYIHLYNRNEIMMNFDTPLAAFDGRTAFEVAQEAYAYHPSQRSEWLRILQSNLYDCRKYGLYFTTVGEDVKKDDFLENIPLSSLSVTPSPIPTFTPAPTVTPEPTPAPTATPAPTEAPAIVLAKMDTPTPAPTQVPTATPTPSLTPSSTPVPETAGADSFVTILLIVCGALVLSLLVAVVIAAARRRR